MMITSTPSISLAGTAFDMDNLRLDLGGGLSFYRMSRINDEYIEWISGAIGIFDEKIERGPALSGTIGYRIMPRVSLDIGLTFLRGISANDSQVEWQDLYGDAHYYDFESELRTSLLATEIKAKYYFPFDGVELFAGGGIAWCHGKTIIDVGYENLGPEGYKFTSNGLGFVASLGGFWEIYRPVSFFYEAGYRFYRTGDLKDSNGKRWKLDVLEDAPVMNLDFSGYFFAGGISISLSR